MDWQCGLTGGCIQCAGLLLPAFGEGNSFKAIFGTSVVLWVVHALMLRGIQGATVLNAVVTLAKIVRLLMETLDNPPHKAAWVGYFRFQCFAVDVS